MKPFWTFFLATAAIAGFASTRALAQTPVAGAHGAAIHSGPSTALVGATEVKAAG
jgi:hypothetical protein